MIFFKIFFALQLKRKENGGKGKIIAYQERETCSGKHYIQGIVILFIFIISRKASSIKEEFNKSDGQTKEY